MTRRRLPLVLAFLIVCVVFSPLVGGSRGQDPTFLSLPYALWTALGASLGLLILLGIASWVETTSSEEPQDELP